MTPIEFAALAQQVALRYSASITSWGRTDKHNLSVKGNPLSRHRVWLAMDLAVDDPSLRDDALAYAIQLGLHGIVEPNGCLHLQDRAVL